MSYCDAMERLCPVCKEQPLRGKQKICSSACRSAKYREAQKQRAERDASQAEQKQKTPASIVHRRRPPPKERAMQKQESADWTARLWTQLERLVDATAELRSLVKQPVTPPRIDMCEQVTAQAPEGAVGYRLVLPCRDGMLPPKIIPRRNGAVHRAWYSLTPFEYPDDLRLCDGCWYRIVWIDSQGNRIRAERGAPIPGLCFVVGPIGQEQNVQTTQAGMERSATAALPDLRCADEKARTENPSVMQLPSVTAAQSSGPAALAETSSVPNTETVTADPQQTEQPAVMPLQRGTAAPTELSPPPATPASRHVDTSAPSDSAPVTAHSDTSQGLDPGNPYVAMLSPGTSVLKTDGTAPPSVAKKPKSQLDPFWDGPGKFAKQLESLAQVLYEQRLSAAQEAGLPLPEEPLTQLSREERNKIKRDADHPFWKALGRCLIPRLAQATSKGIGAFASLPIVPTPLDDKDKRLMDEVLANPDKRVYLDYLYARRDALLVGDTLPKEPPSTLSTAVRKRLVKIVADVRPIAELLSKEAAEEV